MKRGKKKLLLIFAFMACLLTAGYLLANYLTEASAHIKPAYAKIDLDIILKQKEFTKADYQTLFYQTGLGKIAVDELKANNSNFKEKILHYQDVLFSDVSFTSQNNAFLSRGEYTVNEIGEASPVFEPALVKNGYILVTKSSVTLGWRHGHSAIVVDQIKGKTLESVVLGTNSRIVNINKWAYYPNVMVLKLKDDSGLISVGAAQYALHCLNDIPYCLSTGVFSDKDQAADPVKGTQCAHLVWQAYQHFGIDLDSNGGKIVTPKDIVNSPFLEVVQVFGVDPRQIWP